MKAPFALALALVLAWTPTLQADLKRALAEPNLEKRSKLALDNAKAALLAAREAYSKGEMEQVQAFANEMEQSVDLALRSLADTGKNPRSSPRYFKSAEQETSQLVRRIDTFQQDMSYTERPLLDKTKARVQQVHDQLLLELMEGKKK
jgi:hypothetical protein